MQGTDEYLCHFGDEPFGQAAAKSDSNGLWYSGFTHVLYSADNSDMEHAFILLKKVECIA